MATSEFQRVVDPLKGLLDRQRQVNDQQLEIRRAAWDLTLENLKDPAEVQTLLKQFAADPSAW